MFNLLPSLIRYILIGLSAAIVQGLVDNGFDPADAEQFAQAGVAFGTAAGVIIWSWKKNKKIADERKKLQENNGDPITWNEPKKETKYND